MKSVLRTLSAISIATAFTCGCAELATSPTGAASAPWWNDQWRCRSTVVAPAERFDRANVTVSVPADFEKDLAALGLQGKVDPRSIRVFECDPESGKRLGEKENTLGIRTALVEGRLYWLMEGSTRAGRERAYQIYYDTDGRADYPAPPQLEGADFCGDYATDTYGDSWDFNEDDFEGIAGWGNKPECVPSKKVADGILSLDIKGDGYFIWGKMWGDIGPADKTENIDLDRYSILEIRTKQSAKSAVWEIYGRCGTGERLLTHKFWVPGGDWRTIKIDLKKDAGWRGKLTALRIDPAQVEEGAHVEIDWIRLANRVLANRQPTVVNTAERQRVSVVRVDAEKGSGSFCAQHPSGLAGKRSLTPFPTLVAGTESPLAVEALDAAGCPVGNVDIAVKLIDPNGALLAAGKSRSAAVSAAERHGLTDSEGLLLLTLKAPTKAAVPMRVMAFAAVGGNPSGTAMVTATAAKPSQYLVSPAQVQFRPEKDAEENVTAQLADEFGNPVSESGIEVKWLPTDGMALSEAVSATDGAGIAHARVKFDPAARTVYTVQCEDKQGRKGESSAVVFYSTRPKSDPIGLLPDGYFACRDGKQFVPLGGFYLNYVYYGEKFSQLKQFVDATEEEMKASLAYLAVQGVTGARFMLRAHRPGGMEPMDIGGG